jgi:putative hemolysin
MRRRKIMKRMSVVAVLLALVLSACAPATPTAVIEQQPGIANPASENCVAKGGALQMQKNPNGGEYGVCVFEDNLQCEEWAMFRGDCPVGGIKITGYITPAAVYCAITGGQYDITGNSGEPNETGTCTFKNNKVCDAAEYFAGACSADN